MIDAAVVVEHGEPAAKHYMLVVADYTLCVQNIVAVAVVVLAADMAAVR